MKRFILKTVAVISAFFIGVFINNSCGKSERYETTPSSTQELWNSVRSLTAEITQLKEDVSQLQSEIETLKTTGDNNGEFLVDGLYFNRAGNVTSKPKSWTDSRGQRCIYTYDNQGRMSRYQTVGLDVKYEYSGKTVTATTVSSANDISTTSVSKTEYY